MASRSQKVPQKGSRKQHSRSVVVKDCFCNAFEERCDAALKKLGLQKTETPLPLLGSRPLDAKSRHACACRIRKFAAFCIKEGFDESLLPFCPCTPKGAVSAEEGAMVSFLHSMCTPIDEPATDMHGNDLVNPRNKQIKGVGCWKDPDIVEGLKTAATHALINAHGHCEAFWEACQNCKNAAANHNFSGCQHHSPARLVRIGNVMTSVSVNDTVCHVRNNSNHVVRGACHLLPSHVRLVREHAQSSNDIFWFQICTVLLVSIELFLRKMECKSLTLENFNQNMFVMSDEHVVEALNLKVRGKKKRKKKKRDLNEEFPVWRTLHIWGDDRFADVDSKRHLLGCLCCIGWKGGTLFPTKRELENPPADRVHKTTMTEDDLCGALKCLFKTVLERDDKLTAHTGRKSGCLWNRIRGADSQQLMTAAAHDACEVAARHAKDCDAARDVHSVFDDRNQQLGTFRNCCCAGDETAVDSASPGRQFQKPLPQIVVGFIENRVGVDPNDAKARHPRHVMEKILGWQKPENNIDVLKGHLEDISEDKTNAIVGCVCSLQNDACLKAEAEMSRDTNDRVHKKLREMLGQFSGHLALTSTNSAGEGAGGIAEEFQKFLTGLPGMSDLQTVPVPVTPPPTRRRESESRRGTEKLPVKKNFGKWKAQDKLDCTVNNCDCDTGEHINGDRQWLQRAAKAHKCFATCCRLSVEMFLEKHGKGAKRENFSLGDAKGCETCPRGC